MPFPSKSDRVIVSGQYGTVEYVVRSDGKTMEAKEWLETQSETKRASFATLFKKIVDHGRISNKTQFRRLRNEVWEFKRSGDRLLCYIIGNRRLLTHHYAKGGQKCPPRQIERADRIGREHIQLEMDERKKRRKNR